MTDHRDKINVIITDAPAATKSQLSAAMQRAASAQQVVVGAQAFDTQGHISRDALDVISTVMSRGGTVVVDLPAAARQADTFNAFASAVMGAADAKAGHRNNGQMLFAGPVDAPLVTEAKAPAPRR